MISLAFQRLDRINNWFDLTITIFRSNTKMLVDINQFFVWSISISVWSFSNSVWSISFFCVINQKIIRHTENFWGSGSYSKNVRPNGFFIYRRFGSFTMPNIVISPEISTCEQNSTSPSHLAFNESTQSLVRPHA